MPVPDDRRRFGGQRVTRGEHAEEQVEILTALRGGARAERLVETAELEHPVALDREVGAGAESADLEREQRLVGRRSAMLNSRALQRTGP